MFPLPPIAKNDSGSFLTTDTKVISASLNDYARSGTLDTGSLILSGSTTGDGYSWATGSNGTIVLTTTVPGTYTVYYTIGANIAGSCATQLRSNKAKVTTVVTEPTTTTTTTTTSTTTSTTTVAPTTTTTSTTTSTTTAPPTTTTTTTSTTTSTTTPPPTTTTTTTSTTTTTTTAEPTTTTSTTTTTTTAGSGTFTVKNTSGSGQIDDVTTTGGAIFYLINTGTFPLTSGQQVDGSGASLTSAPVIVTISNYSSTSCLSLYINGGFNDNLQVSGNGTYTFTNKTFTSSDVVLIEYVSGVCF